jgi:hypothetical protein
MTLEGSLTPDDRHREAARRGWLLTFVRYILPAAVVIAGLVVMSLGGESDLEGGAGIVGAGLAIFFLNWLFRAGASGEREREAEEAARDYFDRHGRWPD